MCVSYVLCLATFNFVVPFVQNRTNGNCSFPCATLKYTRYRNVQCSSTSRYLGSRQRVPTTGRPLRPSQHNQFCTRPPSPHRVSFIPPLAPIQPPQLTHTFDRSPHWDRRSTLCTPTFRTILAHHVILRRIHQLACLASLASTPPHLECWSFHNGRV